MWLFLKRKSCTFSTSFSCSSFSKKKNSACLWRIKETKERRKEEFVPVSARIVLQVVKWFGTILIALLSLIIMGGGKLSPLMNTTYTLMEKTQITESPSPHSIHLPHTSLTLLPVPPYNGHRTEYLPNKFPLDKRLWYSILRLTFSCQVGKVLRSFRVFRLLRFHRK